MGYTCAKDSLEVSQEIKMDDSGFLPGYLDLHKKGELVKRGQQLFAMLNNCSICPRKCGTNRLKGERGFCGASKELQIAAHHPHFGEERPLVGRGGSGTIFLTNCNLRCVFCINWDISQGGRGKNKTIGDLADMMIALQKQGCQNINMVTPTHYAPHIILALEKAASNGLKIPLVYNTCGWENIEVLKMLDGVVDIYLPDFKYDSSDQAAKYSKGASSCPTITKQALVEMNRQVGTAHPDKDGVIHRGLMIRHLVMPNNVSGSSECLKWIAQNLPKDTNVNIMSQYSPVYKAPQYPKISRRISYREYHDAVEAARQTGLTNLEIQGYPRVF